MFAGLMWLLAGHSFSWAVDLRPPSVPHHAGHSNTAACFIEAHKPKRQQSESDSKMEVTISCNLIIEMASVTFAKYVRSKLWVLPSLREYTKRWGSLGVILEVCLPLTGSQWGCLNWEVTYFQRLTLAFLSVGSVSGEHECSLVGNKAGSRKDSETSVKDDASLD